MNLDKEIADVVVLRPLPTDKLLEVFGEDNRPLVTMLRNGVMTFGEGYQPEAAAIIFWRAVEQMVPPALLVRDDAT